jgi:hypothetical protein
VGSCTNGTHYDPDCDLTKPVEITTAGRIGVAQAQFYLIKESGKFLRKSLPACHTSIIISPLTGTSIHHPTYIMDSSSSMNLDYMPIENNMTNGYGGDDNSDLNQIFESSQYGATSSNGMFAFGSGFTPNGMNIDGGMGGNFAQNAMFQAGSNQGQLEYQPQTSAFSFPQQQVDPSAIMRPNETQDSECSQESSEPSQQQGETGASKTKKTRRSKKKPLTKAQEEQKREEFLERNRVAVSPKSFIQYERLKRCVVLDPDIFWLLGLGREYLLP